MSHGSKGTSAWKAPAASRSFIFQPVNAGAISAMKSPGKRVPGNRALQRVNAIRFLARSNRNTGLPANSAVSITHLSRPFIRKASRFESPTKSNRLRAAPRVTLGVADAPKTAAPAPMNPRREIGFALKALRTASDERETP
jgi:hypothetical protein